MWAARELAVERREKKKNALFFSPFSRPPTLAVPPHFRAPPKKRTPDRGLTSCNISNFFFISGG